MVDKPAAPDNKKDFFRNSLRESIYNKIEWVLHCSANKIKNILNNATVLFMTGGTTWNGVPFMFGIRRRIFPGKIKN